MMRFVVLLPSYWEVLGNKNGKGTFSWADGSSYQVPAHVVACTGCAFTVEFNVDAFSMGMHVLCRPD